MFPYGGNQKQSVPPAVKILINLFVIGPHGLVRIGQEYSFPDTICSSASILLDVIKKNKTKHYFFILEALIKEANSHLRLYAIVIAPKAAFHRFPGTNNYQCNKGWLCPATILQAFRWPGSPVPDLTHRDCAICGQTDLKDHRSDGARWMQDISY